MYLLLWIFIWVYLINKLWKYLLIKFIFLQKLICKLRKLFNKLSLNLQDRINNEWKMISNKILICLSIIMFIVILVYKEIIFMINIIWLRYKT